MALRRSLLSELRFMEKLLDPAAKGRIHLLRSFPGRKRNV
jgi:hypothetical protein